MDSDGASDLSSWSVSYDRHAFVHHDEDAGGTLWGRGRGYRASANAAGFTFIPFLGSDAAKNHPVRLRLGEARRGLEVMSLDEVPIAVRQEDRIVLDHGPVRARYDLMPEGVEQSFELDAAPGSGNLVLSILVETDLEVARSGGGFEFSNGRGGVRYGAASVYDAAGRKIDIESSWSAGAILLTVPTAFLHEATWPIVVDPLLTPFVIANSSVNLGSPDVSFDRPNRRYGVVFEERFSATDVDIYTWYVGLDGTVSGGAYVEQTTASWTAPCVSMTRDLGFAFVVAEGDSVAIPGSKDLVMRVREPDGTFRVPDVIAVATSDYSCADPDIGTDFFTGQFSSQVVAYNRVYATRRDIYTMYIEYTGARPERPLAADPARDTSAPSISSVNALCCLNPYIIGWSERDLATGAFSVRVAQTNYDGGSPISTHDVAAPSTSAIYFDVSISGTMTAPHPTLNSPVYLVTYDDRPSNVTDSFVALCAGARVLNTYELQELENADRTPNQNSVRIATGRDKFMIGYEEGGDLYMTTVAPIDDELGVLERRSVVSGAAIAPGSLAAVGAIYPLPPAGTPDWGGAFVWTQQSSSSNEIAGSFATIPATPGELAGIQYCYGTANSTGDRGFIQGFGSLTAGALHALQVSALPPNTFGYYLASTTTGNVPNAGGSQGTLCLGGSIGRFGVFQTDATGTALGRLGTSHIAQPLGPVAAMAGESWNFQCWHRDSLMGSATSNFTNAVTLPFR